MKSKLFIVILGVVLFASCSDFIEVPSPETELVQELVFEEDNTALAAMAGPYAHMSSSLTFASGGGYSITLFESFYADELTSFASSTTNSPLTPFYLNNLIATNSIANAAWSDAYNIIYAANRIREGLDASTGVSEPLKKQLKGEALFIRAFCHFYLVNLFGDVPLITGTDYSVNTKAPRTATAEVYAQIIEDLLEAKALLTDTYPSEGRARANKGAATALLARAYLYAGEYANAETQTTELINNTAQYQLLGNLNSVFLKSSQEAIWQLIPTNGDYTNEATYFILVAPPASRALTDNLVNAFETNDGRKQNWVNSITSASGLTTWYFPFKYKENHLNATGAEASMVLRVAEQYLIRAEARARLNKLTGSNSATSDINAIRNRAGLGNTTATTQSQLLDAIAKERRTELFTEWGHRFFDLKRWNQLDAVLDPVKPNWDTTDALLPIPQSEILVNPNLTQNLGY